MSREILAVQGIEKLTPTELQELVAVADRRGLNPSYLAGTISFETGGTFSPSMRNKWSGAMGLIQFMPKTAKHYGTTTDDLAHMTVNQQLAYVELHYAEVDPNKRIKSLEDHYLAVFSPACIGKPPNTLMPCRQEKHVWHRPEGGCPRPLKGAYCQNSGLDESGDGTITAWEATTPVRRIIMEAEGKPRIIVGDGPIEPLEPLPHPPHLHIATAGFGGTLAPFVLGAVAGYFAIGWLREQIP